MVDSLNHKDPITVEQDPMLVSADPSVMLTTRPAFIVELRSPEQMQKLCLVHGSTKSALYLLWSVLTRSGSQDTYFKEFLRISMSMLLSIPNLLVETGMELVLIPTSLQLR